MIVLLIQTHYCKILSSAEEKRAFSIARTPEGRSLSCNTFGCDVTEIVSTSRRPLTFPEQQVILIVQWTWYSRDAYGNGPRYHEGLSQKPPPPAVPEVAKTDDFYAVRVTRVSP